MSESTSYPLHEHDTTKAKLFNFGDLHIISFLLLFPLRRID